MISDLPRADGLLTSREMNHCGTPGAGGSWCGLGKAGAPKCWDPSVTLTIDVCRADFCPTCRAIWLDEVSETAVAFGDGQEVLVAMGGGGWVHGVVEAVFAPPCGDWHQRLRVRCTIVTETGDRRSTTARTETFRVVAHPMGVRRIRRSP